MTGRSMSDRARPVPRGEGMSERVSGLGGAAGERSEEKA